MDATDEELSQLVDEGYSDDEIASLYEGESSSPTMSQPTELPDSTGSFFGDTLDAIGGGSRGYLRGIADTFGDVADLGASTIASGVRSAQTGDLQWVPSDLVSDTLTGMVDDLSGDVGRQSAAGRIAQRGGELTGNAVGFLTGGAGLAKAPGLLGKAGALFASGPKQQLLLSALGGTAGQGAVEAGLVDQGGMGQAGVELGTMVAPGIAGGLFNLGKAATQPLRRYFYQNAPEAADEVVRSMEKISGANLLDDYGQSSSALGRSMQLAEDVGGKSGIKRATGEVVGEVKDLVRASSSEVAQLMDEATKIKQVGKLSGWTPALIDRAKEIDNTLATLPKVDTKVVQEGFPLLNAKYGDFVKGTEKVVSETPNEAFKALQKLEATNRVATSIYSDLTSVFKIGKKSGKSFSAKDYEKATERIGTTLLTGKGITAKDFTNVMESYPEGLAIGKQAALGEVFKGDPKDWLKQLNEKRSPLVTLLGKEAAPEAMKVLDDLAGKHVDTVAGHMASYIHGFLGKKLIMTGLAAASIKTGGLAIPATGVLYLADKAAKAVASKPTEMTTWISKALVSPEARKLLSAKATPQNIKAALESFKIAGRNAIMGVAGNDEEITDLGVIGLSGRESSTEKKSEVVPEDRDTTPKTSMSIKQDIADVESEIDSDPYFSAVYEAESTRNPMAQPRDPKTGKLLSSAKGGFQLIDSTARNLGVKDAFDLRQNFEGFKKLTDENARAIKSEDPSDLYSAHYLGAPLYKKWMAGKPLDDTEQSQVDYLLRKALPRFNKIYKNSRYQKAKISEA